MEQQHPVFVLKRSPRSKRATWHFSYPHEVVNDPALTVEEKRAFLASWASDIHAVKSLPVMRHLPGTPFPVTFSSIMNAMDALDRLSFANDDDPPPPPKTKRIETAPPNLAPAA